MKKIFIVIALAATVAGCVTGKEILDRVAAVQTYTRVACSYVPAVASVTALFNKDAAASVADIGGAICSVVNAAPLADGPANFRVRGVMVHGVFVR